MIPHLMYPPSGPYQLTTGRYMLWCTCGWTTQRYVYAELARKMWERHAAQAVQAQVGSKSGCSR